MTTQDQGASIHASAVKVGDRGVLIRGPSGAGKSQLAFALILAGRAGVIPPTELVGDDRVHLDAEGGALIVRAAKGLAGLIEIRGLGIRRLPFADRATVSLVVDLEAEDADRLPPASSLETQLNGVKLPRIPVGKGPDPVPQVIAALTTFPGEVS
jgi:HPr kinase/phosphorylase